MHLVLYPESLFKFLCIWAVYCTMYINYILRKLVEFVCIWLIYCTLYNYIQDVCLNSYIFGRCIVPCIYSGGLVKFACIRVVYCTLYIYSGSLLKFVCIWAVYCTMYNYIQEVYLNSYLFRRCIAHSIYPGSLLNVDVFGQCIAPCLYVHQVNIV